MKQTLVALCLLLSTLLGSVSLKDYAVRTLDLSQGTVTVTEYTEDRADLTVQHRNYEFYNGDRVWMGHVTAKRDISHRSMAEFTLPVSDGTLRLYDGDVHRWEEKPLKVTHVSAACMVVSLESGGEVMIFVPKTYEPQGAGTLRHLPNLDGSLELTRSETGWTLRLRSAAVPKNCVVDYTVAYSPDGLLDWDDQRELDYWNGSVLDITGQWCFDGYYYPSPTTYVPTGEQFYYRNTASYLCRNISWGLGKVRVAELLTVAMLDTLTLQQNEYGYFPTLPESTWLSGSYQIPGGFYDTRFNSDLAEIFYQLTTWTRCRQFDEVMERYFDFFLNFAREHHEETAGGGWLVEDYWHPHGGVRTHTSLNHQLAEILTLYHFADGLDRPELEELAEQMLLGIVETASDWIRRDQNLHYSYRPNGSYGGRDYPYLTYNDLLHLQRYLETRGKEKDALQDLMHAKKAWMDRNGVKDYEK